MRDYYHGVSGFDAAAPTNGGIDVQGEVHGWFRLPHPLSFYANGLSGQDSAHFPKNEVGMAADTLKIARQQGVKFPEELDVLGEGIVTALFIVHMRPRRRGGPEGPAAGGPVERQVELHPGFPTDSSLTVQTFLTVPEDCRVGVCSHEWGHLAARWADFYDTGNPNVDAVSSGLGDYCLMASGSWGGPDRQHARRPAGVPERHAPDVPRLDPAAEDHQHRQGHRAAPRLRGRRHPGRPQPADAAQAVHRGRVPASRAARTPSCRTRASPSTRWTSPSTTSTTRTTSPSS